MKNADFVRFGFNLTDIEHKMNQMGYKITPEFVNETFYTTILTIKTQRPTNYTCFKEPECTDVIEQSYEQPLAMFNNFTVPNLDDTLKFLLNKMTTEDRPVYIEEELEPDLRPPPELEIITLFSNSSVKLSFNEPV